MRIKILASSPTYGGGGTLALVGDFLLDGLPDAADSDITIDVDLLVRGEPRAPWVRPFDEPTDEELAALEPDRTIAPGVAEDNSDVVGGGPDDPGWGDEHERNRARGTSLTYRRTANKVALRVISDLSEYDIFATHDPTPETFATAAREVVSALEALPRRVRTGDALDALALMGHLRSRLTFLPTRQDELDMVLAPLAEAEALRWETMDPWDIVDVDWSEFAPGTQERLNDPFFFDPSDDEAPHGNDTGADLLADYLNQRPADPLAFLQRQAEEFGQSSLEVLRNAAPWEHDELVIATAFAELKVHGRCSPGLKRLAFQALDRRHAEAASPRTAQLRAALA